MKTKYIYKRQVLSEDWIAESNKEFNDLMSDFVTYELNLLISRKISNGLQV